MLGEDQLVRKSQLIQVPTVSANAPAQVIFSLAPTPEADLSREARVDQRRKPASNRQGSRSQTYRENSTTSSLPRLLASEAACPLRSFDEHKFQDEPDDDDALTLPKIQARGHTAAATSRPPRKTGNPQASRQRLLLNGHPDRLDGRGSYSRLSSTLDREANARKDTHAFNDDGSHQHL